METDHESLEYRNVLIYPRRKFLGISIYLKVDRPGVLREVLSVIEKWKINLNYIYGFSGNKSHTKITTVMDLTDRNIDVGQVIKEIESIDAIDRVKTFEPSTDGLIADTTSFPLTVFGERVFMLRKSVFKEMILGLMKGIGPQLTAQLLYQMGVNMGRRGAKRHKEIAERLGLKDPMDILKKVSVPIFQSLGYAMVELESDEKENIIVKKKDCIECVALKEIIKENPYLNLRGYEPKCNMVRGMIEGAVSEILGRKYRSMERKCIVEGADLCEIVLSPS